jgi:Icc-related predicted phosphoesterase
LDIQYKIFIAGNHDTSMEAGLIDKIPDSLIYLRHESVIIEGTKIFGSPFTPTFGTGWAYNVDDDKIGLYWDIIPDDTDILITHGPPKTILDVSYGGINCGCKKLLHRTYVVAPKYHIFGHIHEDGGKTFEHGKTTYINAAVVDLSHKQVNNGHIIEI